MKHHATSFTKAFGAAFLRLAGLIAVSCLLFAAPACGDGEDSDEPIAGIASESFTFSESDSSKNTVEVFANTSWTVYWTPASAAVEISPASGSGVGQFRIVSMPKGTSIQVGVRPTEGGRSGKTITVTRKGVADEDILTLSPPTLKFSPANPAANVISVTCNTTWSVSPSNPALRFTPASGEGNGKITIADIPAGESYKLFVTTGDGPAAKTESVTVTRDPDVAGDEPFFTLDFGSTTPNGAWADQDPSWKTQTGSGAGSVTYAIKSTKIQRDNYGSAGKYTGASGGAYAKMFYTPTDYFHIEKITLPAAETDYTLTFGAIFETGDVALSVSSDGSNWKPLTYTGAPTYNTWTKVTVGFTLKKPVDNLYIAFSPTGVERGYGLNFDDVALTAGGGGQQIDLSPATDRWVELPSNFETPTSDQAVYTTWSTTVTSHKRVRNYSYCYDTRRHNPVWVAYPHHACYNEGGYGRTTPDPWHADPALSPALQSKIYQDGSWDNYQFWTTGWMSSVLGSGYWSRGHLCMSRERGGRDQQINIQTFRPTNIAPQPSAPSTFGGIWGDVENLFSGTNNSGNTDFTADDGQVNVNLTDTLYLVAGCYYENDSWTEKDASNSGSLSADSKTCVMPTHQFKMGLRLKTGVAKKKVSECSADELQAVAFWIGTMTTGSRGLRQYAVPVSEVEQKMGITFFPGVPDAVKQNFDPEEWGF